MNRFVVALLAVGLLAAVGCSEEPGDPGENIITPPENRNQDNQEPENQNQNQNQYEAGPLDGVWDLSWPTEGDKVFATFTIEHNLTEGRIRADFDTPDDGDGPLDSAVWQNERFTATWEPYPETMENEMFTITQSEFADGSDSRLEGMMSAISSFDFRNFVMVKVE